MKNFTKKIIIVSLVGLPMISNAQFATNGPFFNYGFTSPVTIQKIGIGSFPTNASVQAKFQINEFLLAPNAATSGFMFRTDGSNTVSNSWQLFTGATTGSVTEKFRLFVPANSNDVTLQTTQNGIMRFNTNGINRFKIMQGGTTNTAGRVAMGNNLPLGFTATARLHLHQTSGTNNLRFTTDATGSTNTDGFQIRMSNTGDASFVNHEANANFSWYNRGTAPSFLLGRMRLYDGGVGQTTGRLLIGNDLPVIFTPLDRLHLYEKATTGFTAVRYQNSLTGATANDGYRMGVDNTNKEAKHTQFEKEAIIFESPDARNSGAITNWLHISNGLTGYAGYSTDGYVGLNEDSAKFHLDIKTPFKNLGGISYGGELFLSCRTSDVPYSRMGMLNIAGGDSIFSATLFGNIDSSQTGSGLNTLAVIHPKQDSSFNLTPVQRFMVGKDWEYNTNAVDAISELENRNAFSWQNVSNVKMLMNAKGRVRIGNSINLSDTIKNRLVITSSTIDPGLGVLTTAGGSSGLQFTNLTTATPPLTSNPGLGVLAVDSVGNVIYINADSIGSGGSGGGMGSACGSSSPAQLTANSEIDLNNFDFHFTGNGGTMQQNNVGIGTNCLNPLAGKLHVYRSSTDLASTGAYILNTDDSDPINNTSSVGLFVKNSAVDVPFTSCRSVAGWFETVSDASGETGFAVYVPDGGGRVSIGFGFNNMQPDNNEPEVCGFAASTGLLEVNGQIYATGITVPSDINFKTNIIPITNALNKVKKLNGVYYDFQTANFPNMNFSSDRQVGLIAQNVDTVLTEVVKYDSLLGAYTMDYSKINALLIEAIKEQQSQIDSMNVLVATQDSINTDLETRLATLEACINNIGICNNGGGNGQGNNRENTQTVTLQNINAIVLDQNLPNPFAESTQINYVLPDDVMNAKMLFYDMNGRIINEVNINERGNGTLTVYGENLEKGIYTYSLIADGKLIATKKMVKK